MTEKYQVVGCPSEKFGENRGRSWYLETDAERLCKDYDCVYSFSNFLLRVCCMPNTMPRYKYHNAKKAFQNT
jgi:hypothetical protein